MKPNNANRLAKNTFYMYLRTGILMLISLYTSRVVLQQLGVEDYGVYGLVGSIVAMFTSLRGLFASSTQRFLNYEMGQKSYDRLRIVFNMSLIINILIAVIFVIGVELVGFWFFKYKINIDPERIFAAKCVFQCSIISVVLGILSTPYDAVIIAHEKMNIYAIVSIVEALLKLLIVYLLTLFSVDKLILYGSLQVLVSVIVILINILYCNLCYKESRISFVWDSTLFKQMSSFAGWNFLGNTSYSLTQSGLNMVLNIFGGPLINAARGIAYQVQTIVTTFLTNVNIVVNPHFIKIYSSGEIEHAFAFMYLSSKIFFYIQLLLTIIFCFFGPEILMLWLGQIPDYTIVFMNLILVNSIIRSLHYPIDALFKARGNLKYYQIIEGTVLSLPLVFSYIALREGLSYSVVYELVILFEIINFIAIILLASKVTNLNIKIYINHVLRPCIVCSIVAVLFFIVIQYLDSIVLKLGVTLFCIILNSVLMWYVGLSKSEKHSLMLMFNK